jgi:hypothetical protein
MASLLKVAVEELRRAWIRVVDAPDAESDCAESDCRDILCTAMACLAES